MAVFQKFANCGRALMMCGVVFAAPHVSAQDNEPSNKPSHQANPTGERIILHVNRNLDVFGWLALEDDDVIAVRDLQGQIESYPKARITQIVRLVDPRPDQSGVVILRDGTTREGVVIEDAFDYVLLEIHGIRAKLKREIVSHVVLQPTFEQRYAEYKAALQPGMYDAHYGLCKWLVDQRKYDLAKRELTELLDQNAMPEAIKLMTVVDAQLALAQKSESNPKPTPNNSITKSSEADESVETSHDTPDRPIVSKADVNVIRVYEIDFDR